MPSYRLPFPNPDLADGFRSMAGRSHPHRGLDFAQPAGRMIPAIADGTVAAVTWTEALGFITVLKHERAPLERAAGLRPVFSGYCHQDHRPPLRIGAAVKLGAIVGLVGRQGANGTAANGEHLHLTMSHEVGGVIAGEVFDPYKFIRRYATGSEKPAKPRTYTVKRGDTLYGIAGRSGASIATLVQLNHISNADHIEVGQRLILP